jgi:hypothetical protein
MLKPHTGESGPWVNEQSPSKQSRCNISWQPGSVGQVPHVPTSRFQKQTDPGGAVIVTGTSNVPLMLPGTDAEVSPFGDAKQPDPDHPAIVTLIFGGTGPVQAHKLQTQSPGDGTVDGRGGVVAAVVQSASAEQNVSGDSLTYCWNVQLLVWVSAVLVVAGRHLFPAFVHADHALRSHRHVVVNFV